MKLANKENKEKAQLMVSPIQLRICDLRDCVVKALYSKKVCAGLEAKRHALWSWTHLLSKLLVH